MNQSQIQVFNKNKKKPKNNKGNNLRATFYDLFSAHLLLFANVNVNNKHSYYAAAHMHNAERKAKSTDCRITIQIETHAAIRRGCLFMNFISPITNSWFVNLNKKIVKPLK